MKGMASWWIAVALLVVAPARAQLLEELPVEGEEPTLKSEVAQPSAPPAAKRDWLRADRPEAAAAPESEAGALGWAPAVAFVLLSALAGGAAFLRFGRRERVGSERPTALSVTAQTRVGPKASVALLRVGGRTLLLGVTEHAVSALGWMDSAPAQSAAADTNADDEEAMLAPGDGRFTHLLSSALRRNPAEAADPATLLASRTEDIVGARGATPRVEAQVAGLTRRRR